jgi:hypothetical protein
MNEEEKRNYLDELLKKRPVPDAYKKHVQEDEKEEVCRPPKKTKPIMNLIKKKGWEDLSISLFNEFNLGNAHWAMKIYYENESNKELIIPTMLFDAYNALKSI